MSQSYTATYDGVKVNLQISPVAGITWTTIDEDSEPILRSLDVVDVAGADQISNVMLSITYSQLEHGCWSRPSRKQPRTVLFTMASAEDCAEAVKVVINMCRNEPLLAPIYTRRLLVLVNPTSHNHEAEEIYQKCCAPIFASAGISSHVIVSRYRNHFKDIIGNKSNDRVDLRRFDGIVCVGGDGTVHECLQGLMMRGDRERARHLPIGQICMKDAGSLSLSQGCHDPTSAALLIAKGTTRPLDVMRVSQGSSNIFSFSAIQWGLLADVIGDCGQTNRLFSHLAFAKRMATLKSYSGSAALMLPKRTVPRSVCSEKCKICSHPRSTTVPVAADSWVEVDLSEEIQHEIRQIRDHPPTLDEIMANARSVEDNDDLDNDFSDDILSDTSDMPVEASTQERSKTTTGPNQSQRPESAEIARSSIDRRARKNIFSGRQSLACIQEADDYVLFCVRKMATADMQTCSFAHTSDGLMDVITAKKGISRIALLKSLAQHQSAGEQNTAFQYRKAQQLTFDTHGEGKLAIDGEIYPNAEPITVEVLHAYWTIFGTPIAPPQQPVAISFH